MKSSRIGQRRTPVKFFKPTKTIENGFPKTVWDDVFGGFVYAVVEYAHGNDMFASDTLKASGSATINIPFTNLVTSECEVQIGDDERRYRIVGEPSNVLGKRSELEIFIQREVLS